MNAFVTPEWESNAIADKTCAQLFKNPKPSTNKKKNNKKAKKDKLRIKSGHIEKPKSKHQLKKLKNTLRNPKVNIEEKSSNTQLANINKNVKKKVKNMPSKVSPPIENKFDTDDGEGSSKMKKNKSRVTPQTLFSQTAKKKHNKNMEISRKDYKKLKRSKIKNASDIDTKQYQEKLNMQDHFSPKTAKKLKLLPLRERMLEKLKAARFRYLNEQMYTTTGKDAKKYFDNDPEAYQAYHDGYRQQVDQWPINPVDVVIEKIKKLSRSHIIADFGCGEAKLAKSVLQKVYSFDLVAINSLVTPCDIAHVPLEDDSVNVVVFCLSLMGTNMRDYLLEARRVLKIGGLLKIAEVESRFNGIDNFIKSVEALGFTKINKNLSYELFCFIDFVKKEVTIKTKKKLPNITLEPCLYKKR